MLIKVVNVRAKKVGIGQCRNMFQTSVLYFYCYHHCISTFRMRFVYIRHDVHAIFQPTLLNYKAYFVGIKHLSFSLCLNFSFTFFFLKWYARLSYVYYMYIIIILVQCNINETHFELTPVKPEWQQGCLSTLLIESPGDREPWW